MGETDTPISCIVTGFDAFGGSSNNPTEQLVEMLPEALRVPGLAGQIHIKSFNLSTCCEDAWSRLEPPLTEAAQRKTLILLTGLADNRNLVTLERFALNIRDYRIPDNNGHCRLDEEIRCGGPPAYRSNLPLAGLQAALVKRNHLVDISSHAGTFVCNDIYYRVLDACATGSCPWGVLFVHFPPAANYSWHSYVSGKECLRAGIPDSCEQLSLVRYRQLVLDILQFGLSWLAGLNGAGSPVTGSHI